MPSSGERQPRPEPGHVGELLSRLTRHDEPPGRAERVRVISALAGSLAASARAAGATAVVTGRWLADVLVEAAPWLPLRDAATLRAQYPGATREEIADALTAAAARASAAVGAVGGAVAGAHFLVSRRRTLFSVPVQLAAETLAVAAVEIKAIAELQELYGIYVPGTPSQRGAAYINAWTNRRGLDVLDPASLTSVVGEATKRHLHRRLLRRAGVNVSSLAPYLAGAAAGAAVNHRETRRLTDRVREDLRRIADARV